jgi:hypothetical protein
MGAFFYAHEPSLALDYGVKTHRIGAGNHALEHSRHDHYHSLRRIR